MIQVDVVSLPRLIEPSQLRGRAVAVFDVLRATTTMATALAAGAREIRLFDSLAAAKEAGMQFSGEKILCGERRALRPEGFDLGNSPGEFTAERVAGKTLFMATTNGTRAIIAARDAEKLFAAALVNATATAKSLVACGLNIILLCAGTDGQIAPEDMIGAGSIVDALQSITPIQLGNTTNDALKLFRENKNDLLRALRASQGGKNCIAAGLDRDIEAAAKLDHLNVVCEISGDPLVARKEK